MNLEELENHIVGCQMGSPLSQRRLYNQFYNLAISICLRHSKNIQEAEEICNDGFIKAFRKIGNLENAGSFKSWLSQIMIHSSIDYFRKFHLNCPTNVDIENTIEPISNNTAIDELSYYDKLALLQKLAPSYRIAFNLYVIDGFSTLEISKLLKISEANVRANVSKARIKLQKMILSTELSILKKK